MEILGSRAGVSNHHTSNVLRTTLFLLLLHSLVNKNVEICSTITTLRQFDISLLSKQGHV